MKMRTLSAILILLALLLLIPATPAQEEGRTLEFTVYLHEPLHVVPERIDEARVGDTLSFRILNPNDNPHDLLVCGDPVHVGSECTNKLAFAAVSPQGEAPLRLTLTQAGTYEYYCTIPGHKQGGMRGELHVQGGPTEKKTPTVGVPVALLALAGLALIARRQTR